MRAATRWIKAAACRFHEDFCESACLPGHLALVHLGANVQRQRHAGLRVGLLHGADQLGAVCGLGGGDRKSTRLNSSHGYISYAVFCLKKKNKQTTTVCRLAVHESPHSV